MATPRAAWALASVRKFGFSSRFTSAQRRSGSLIKRCRTAGSSNWRRASLVLGGKSRHRHRHFACEPRQLGEHVGFQFHPFAADLNECFGKVTIEGVLAATDGPVPPA